MTTADSDLMALAKRMRAMEDEDNGHPLTQGEIRWVRRVRKVCEAAGMGWRVLRWLFVGVAAVAGAVVAIGNMLDKIGGGP